MKKNREFAIISWVSNDLIFVNHKLIDLERFLRVQILTGRSKTSEWIISSLMESIHAYFYGNHFTREPKYYVLRLSVNELFALVELINFKFAPPACWLVACLLCALGVEFTPTVQFCSNVLHSNMWRTSLSLLSSMFSPLISSNNSAFIPIRNSFGG